MSTDVYYVVIECPTTGKATRTGVELPDLDGFRFVGLTAQACRCEHCPETHTWSNRDAWPERHQASRVHVRNPPLSLGKPRP
jgi:hypothetical protein